ncbi:hypothetical protein VTK26DRAFT_6228 [Humicola hyalothermophila]
MAKESVWANQDDLKTSLGAVSGHMGQDPNDIVANLVSDSNFADPNRDQTEGLFGGAVHADKGMDASLQLARPHPRHSPNGQCQREEEIQIGSTAQHVGHQGAFRARGTSAQEAKGQGHRVPPGQKHIPRGPPERSIRPRKTRTRIRSQRGDSLRRHLQLASTPQALGYRSGARAGPVQHPPGRRPSRRRHEPARQLRSPHRRPRSTRLPATSSWPL